MVKRYVSHTEYAWPSTQGPVNMSRSIIAKQSAMLRGTRFLIVSMAPASSVQRVPRPLCAWAT